MSTQDSKIRIKRSTITGQVPTVAPSNDHTDGSWSELDIYKGELFLNQADDRLFTRTDAGIVEIGVASDISAIRSKKISLSAANLLAASSIEVEPAAGSGYAWEVVSMSVDYTHVTTPYDVGVAVLAMTESAATYQVSTKVILSVAASTFCRGTVLQSPSIQLVDNKKLSVKADAASTTGDGTAEVYITYRKIKL